MTNTVEIRKIIPKLRIELELDPFNFSSYFWGIFSDFYCSFVKNDFNELNRNENALSAFKLLKSS